jgi:hypothetical protein
MPINSFLYPAPSTPNFGYDVANSLRFNDGDSASMSKSSSSGDRRQFTISAWVKRGVLGTEQQIYGFRQSASNVSGLFFDGSTDRLKYSDYQGSFNASIVTNRVFRDPSAWYHIVCAVDTDQGTDTNRIKIYVNGTQETSFSTATYPSQNTDLYVNVSGQNHYIGTEQSGRFFDGYMAEVVFIDGTQNAVTDFGEFDSDSPTIWKPIDVSGLTFGTNGFYLDFEDSSNLGNDANGGTDFTVNNLTSVDQSSDSCTNNFATINPLDAYYEASTFSEGNLKIVTESSGYSYNTSTIGLTTGKWYCEVYIEATPHSGTKDSMIGVAGRMSEADLGYLGLYSDTYGIYGGNGNIYNGGSGSSYGVSHTTGDIIGIYLDLDNNKLYFAKNGTLMNSGTGKDITAVSNTTAGAYFMVAADFYNGASGTYRLNFGSPIYSLSSANADANGQGSFEYNPSSGTFDGASKDFLAINTKNLAEFG